MNRQQVTGMGKVGLAGLIVALAGVADAAVAVRARGGSPPVTARGQATYGQHRGGSGTHAHGGHSGWGGYVGIRGHWLSPYAWDYPYGYWGAYWGAPRVYLMPTVLNAPGAFEIDVTPGRAEVWVDGSFAGQARDFNGRWDVLWLAPGEHRIELRKDGYLTLAQVLDVSADVQHVLEAKLARGVGLDPRSGPDSGTGAETTGRGSAANRAAPKERPLAEERPAELQSGFLRFAVRPNDAAVYLDGEFLAHAGELLRLHGAIPVVVGAHTVEVVRPGFAARTVRVEVLSGEPVRVEIGLERAD